MTEVWFLTIYVDPKYIAFYNLIPLIDPLVSPKHCRVWPKKPKKQKITKSECLQMGVSSLVWKEASY